MPKPGPKPKNGENKQVVAIRLSPSEQEAIEGVAGERGEKFVEAIRSIPMLWAEREMLVKAALEPHRGRFSAPELKAALDVMNGVYLLQEATGGEMLGQHVVIEVSDGCEMNGLAEKWEIDGRALVRRLNDLPRVTLVALELWCSDLWRNSEDDAFWEDEIAWLSGAKRTEDA